MEFVEQLQNVSLLMARLLMGGMFAIAAKNKLKDVKGFAQKNEIPYPLGIMVVAIESLSSIGLVFGIFPRVAALLVMGLMSGTMFMHIVKWNSPYWAKEGGWEYDLIWFTFAFLILSLGPGSFAVYSPLFN
ncbi:MAG: DoxX family protein [Bacteriovoracia bacterium]